MSHILIILRIRILGIAGLYLPDTELLFTRTQSFVLAAFATLVCQRNCVFLCKDTKLKIVMPVFCDTELLFWQPLQPWFVKETAFFFAKAQNLR